MKYLVGLFLGLLLVGCATPSNYYKAPILDTWQYEIIDSYGNIWDSGTLEFVGDDDRGEVIENNYYGERLLGSWRVTGDDVMIQASVTINASWLSANVMRGSWLASNGDEGQFRASRRGEKLPGWQ